MASALRISSASVPFRRQPVSPAKFGCVVGKPAASFMWLVQRAPSSSTRRMRSAQASSDRRPRPQKTKGRLAFFRIS